MTTASSTHLPKSPINLVKPISSNKLFDLLQEEENDPYKKNWIDLNERRNFELPPIFRPETALSAKYAKRNNNCG